MICLALLAAPRFSAAPQLPSNHPEVEKRAGAKAVEPQIAQKIAQPGLQPVPIHNFIDEMVFGRMKRDRIPHAGVATDTEFLRRIYLDLTGRLPEPERIRKFVADKDPDKRDKLIDEFMATPLNGQIAKLETPFLDRWAYFFGDLFRVTGLLRGTNLWRDYLYLVLLDNVPYNEVVREMLTAKARSNWLDGPANFLIRDHVVSPDGLTINAEDTYDEIAITTSKLFLGVNLECVSCHNGKDHLEKINLHLTGIDRQRVWQQAAFFSKLRIARPYSIANELGSFEDGKGYDVTGPSVTRMPRYEADVQPQFLLTGERPRQGEPWREAYARMVTTHPQFARATANLIWAELMGVGIVDPPLEFDLARQDPRNPPPAPWTIQPSYPELLDALARDFQEHHFDLRHLIATITKSSTYQLSSNFPGEWKDSYAPYFARHFVHRLPAEQIADAISQATGAFDEIPISGGEKKVKYVMQTYAPEDVGGKETEHLYQLLTLLGRGNRDNLEATRTASMLQSSVLLNSRFVKDHVKIQKNGRLAQLLNQEPPLSNEEIVEEVFLAFLSRWPNSAEKGIGVKMLEQQHAHGLEDLSWSLINKPEFLLNY